MHRDDTLFALDVEKNNVRTMLKVLWKTSTTLTMLNGFVYTDECIALQLCRQSNVLLLGTGHDRGVALTRTRRH